MNLGEMRRKGQEIDEKEIHFPGWTKSHYDFCQICCGVVRKEADSCSFCTAKKLYFEGKNKSMSAAKFKLFRIKIPALAAIGFTALSAWSMWFLLPVPVAGFILCRAAQKYFEGPAWNLRKG